LTQHLVLLIKNLLVGLFYGVILEAQMGTREDLKVVLAEFSTLSLAVFVQSAIACHAQASHTKS
jgi:hypothetical protein